MRGRDSTTKTKPSREYFLVLERKLIEKYLPITKFDKGSVLIEQKLIFPRGDVKGKMLSLQRVTKFGQGRIWSPNSRN
jgi:hypothetical protein